MPDYYFSKLQVPLTRIFPSRFSHKHCLNRSHHHLCLITFTQFSHPFISHPFPCLTSPSRFHLLFVWRWWAFSVSCLPFWFGSIFIPPPPFLSFSFFLVLPLFLPPFSPPPPLCFLFLFPSTDNSDSDLELSMVRHQPEGLDQLQAQTQFTRKELQSLYRGFKNVGTQLAEFGAGC